MFTINNSQFFLSINQNGSDSVSGNIIESLFTIDNYIRIEFNNLNGTYTEIIFKIIMKNLS